MEPLAQFFSGARLLGRGLAMYGHSGGLVLLGIVPALLSGLLLLAAFVTLFVFLDDLAALVTWFADDWAAALRTTVRILAGVALVGLAALLGVLVFTALTLLIGDPFYEKIAELVEDRLGGLPDAVALPWWASLGRSLADSGRLLARSLVYGVPIFALGFVPVVGQVVAPVLGALVAGWFLALELVGVPFARRGLRLADRRAALRAHRAESLGFGVAVFLCFLIPLGAIVVMPAAVAGGTLLARRALGASTA